MIKIHVFKMSLALVLVLMVISTSASSVVDRNHALRDDQNSSSSNFLMFDGPPGVEWKKFFGEPNQVDQGYAVAELMDGYILAGHMWLKPHQHVPTLIRTDKDGNQLWCQTYKNITGYWSGKDILQTTDGGFLFIGTFMNPETQSYDAVIIKTDRNGTEQWNRSYGGPGIEHGTSLYQTLDGGFIIGGQTTSYGSGYSDLFILKTNQNGIEQWNQTYGGSLNEQNCLVQQTQEGCYVIAGNTYAMNPGGNAILIMTNASGVEQWNHTFIRNYGTFVSAFQQTADNGFILTGNARVNPSPGAENKHDIWLAKTDQDGNEIWSHIYDKYGYDEFAYSVQQTLEGGYILAGSEIGIMYVMKTDASGEKSWDINLGIRQDIRGIQQTTDGGYIMTGRNNKMVSNDWDIVLIRIRKPQPITGEAYGPYFGLTDEPVQFLSFARGGVPPYTWLWEFGDDEISNQQNPSHKYTLRGNFSIRLTVSDNTGLPGSSDYDTTWAWIQETNTAPEPPTIIGKRWGAAGEFYEYTFSATDPDNTPLYYMIDWGDNTTTPWLGFYDSGTEITKTYMWDETGKYTIKAKAKDVYDAESDWATLIVRMPQHSSFNQRPKYLFNPLSTYIRFLDQILLFIN